MREGRAKAADDGTDLPYAPPAAVRTALNKVIGQGRWVYSVTWDPGPVIALEVVVGARQRQARWAFGPDEPQQEEIEKAWERLLAAAVGSAGATPPSVG